MAPLWRFCGCNTRVLQEMRSRWANEDNMIVTLRLPNLIRQTRLAQHES